MPWGLCQRLFFRCPHLQMKGSSTGGKSSQFQWSIHKMLFSEKLTWLLFDIILMPFFQDFSAVELVYMCYTGHASVFTDLGCKPIAAERWCSGQNAGTPPSTAAWERRTTPECQCCSTSITALTLACFSVGIGREAGAELWQGEGEIVIQP